MYNEILPELVKFIVALIAISLFVGFLVGYGARDLQERRAQRKACRRVEQDWHTTQGAAYDACEDERVTDHDARAYDLLKKNGLLT